MGRGWEGGAPHPTPSVPLTVSRIPPRARPRDILPTCTKQTDPRPQEPQAPRGTRPSARPTAQTNPDEHTGQSRASTGTMGSRREKTLPRWARPPRTHCLHRGLKNPRKGPARRGPAPPPPPLPRHPTRLERSPSVPARTPIQIISDSSPTRPRARPRQKHGADCCPGVPTPHGDQRRGHVGSRVRGLLDEDVHEVAAAALVADLLEERARPLRAPRAPVVGEQVQACLGTLCGDLERAKRIRAETSRENELRIPPSRPGTGGVLRANARRAGSQHQVSSWRSEVGAKDKLRPPFA